MIIDCDDQVANLAAAAHAHAVVEILAQVLEAAGALDLAAARRCAGSATMSSTICADSVPASAVCSSIDEQRLEADPGLVGARRDW